MHMKLFTIAEQAPLVPAIRAPVPYEPQPLEAELARLPKIKACSFEIPFNEDGNYLVGAAHGLCLPRDYIFDTLGWRVVATYETAPAKGLTFLHLSFLGFSPSVDFRTISSAFVTKLLGEEREPDTRTIGEQGAKHGFWIVENLAHN